MTRALNRPTSRRAFALPLVVLLAMAASLALVLLLERRAVSQRIMARQIAGYTGHHRSAGIREMINRWLTTTRNRVGDALDNGGQAFRLELPGGEMVVVSFADGQGAALIDETNAVGSRRDIIRSMREYLDGLPLELTTYATRSVGPAEISLMAAPAIVIEALVVATVEPQRVPRAVEAILARRNAGVLERQQLPDALRDVGLTEDEQAELLDMLVEAPTLWMVQADVLDQDGFLTSRSIGLMEWTVESRSDPFNQSGPFLTWDEIPLDQVEAESPGPGSYPVGLQPR